MDAKINITSSIVLYEENAAEVKKAIESFVLSPLATKLYLIDNSPENKLQELAKHPKVTYQFVGKNVGFSAGHNLVLNQIKETSDFHLILNPDVSFESTILEELASQLQQNDNLVLVAPKAIYPSEERQYTARKFPTLLELCLRFLGFSNTYTKKMEYRNLDLQQSFSPDFVQGSFMLFKTQELLKLNGFDERFFMYMEDVDICKRIKQSGKEILYYPKESFYHSYKQGSKKNARLFFHHLKSILAYFNKSYF